MKKYQTPSGEIITGYTPESAIRDLRIRKNRTDKYWDICYHWRLHEDGIHLVEIKD